MGDLHDRLSNIFISSFVFSDCLLVGLTLIMR